MTQDTYRGEQDEPGTYNLYAYCANDPIGFVDPGGHKYKPSKAVRYAIKWAYGHNTKYKHHRYDCTNYVSQCVEEGKKKQCRPDLISQYPDYYKTNEYWYSKKYIKRKDYIN